MTIPPTAPALNALLLIYPNFNTLDLTGPLEVISSSAIAKSGTQVRITLAAADELTLGYEQLTLKRDVSFSDLLSATDADADAGLAAYDLLLVPGGDREGLDAAMTNGLVDVVRRFSQLGGTDGGRWVVSVCTGAILLGAAGVLRGKRATTHFKFLDYLGEVCEGQGGGETEVVRKRFVDGGRTENGTRVLTAGGVICGVDAGFWFVRERFGMEVAKGCAELMDYPWDMAEVGATEGYLV